MKIDLFWTTRGSPLDEGRLRHQLHRAIARGHIKKCTCNDLKIAVDGSPASFEAYVNCRCGQQQGKRYSFLGRRPKSRPSPREIS